MSLNTLERSRLTNLEIDRELAEHFDKVGTYFLEKRHFKYPIACEDLNVCHQYENLLHGGDYDKPEWRLFLTNLDHVINRRYKNASARERAEAMYLTITNS